VERDAIADLLPLAIGHDQEASACPWVALTRQTANYPSRKAQAAMAIASGLVPPTPDFVDLLYRCDHCGRCRAASTLPGPLDLGRALWSVRALMVESGAVPEMTALADRFRETLSLYGDLSEVAANLGPGDELADVLFVPGASTMSHTPEAAIAALDALRSLGLRVEIRTDLLDSGQELRELGLGTKADHIQDGLRRRVVDAGYRLVIAGAPKEAFGLRETLADHPVEVRYAGEYLAKRIGVVPRGPRNSTNAVFFHPSEILLHRLDGFEVIDCWLASCLGQRYWREPDPRQNAWPACIERPSPRVPEELIRRLAEQRLHQILVASRNDGGQLTILTCDPFSLNALRMISPPNVEVIDLLVFASRLLRKDGAVGG
jgi:hypothetical protein